MQAGLLRHKIMIQSRSSSLDSYGGETVTWTDEADWWADIRPLRGEELVQAQQIVAKVTHRIIIRHYDGLTTAHRIRFDSRTFDINYIQNVAERDVKDELLCTEVL